jgi:hypothetical protein
MSAHEAAIPMDIRLEELISGDGSDLFWIPKPVTDEQFAASGALSQAVRAYEKAFGTESTLRQLALLLETTRTISVKNAAMRRIREARADINAEAARARAEGDEVNARRLEGLPTPEYPELADDMRELGYAS